MAALATKLKAALNNWDVPTVDIAKDGGARADTSDVKSVLHAQIQRVVLRLCPSSFPSTPVCLEVATRARLFETATQTYVYDRVFVYSAAQLELQPYELSVTSSTTAATGRALEAYCEEDGGEILQADVSNALDATVNQIVQDLGLRVEDGEPDP
jgi:hypothetical protein